MHYYQCEALKASRIGLGWLVMVFLWQAPASWAQSGSHVAGASALSAQTQPLSSAPVPGADAGLYANTSRYNSSGNAVDKGQANLHYQKLPLSIGEAQARIIELTNLIASNHSQAMQDRINQLCEWLGDLVDAHNRMAISFAKCESLKSNSLMEKQAAQKFVQLKNEAQLLKADLLISQGRCPEALGPLVDIVIAEPSTATGEKAYRRLKDLGFSQEAVEPIAARVTVPAKRSVDAIASKTAVPAAKPVQAITTKTSVSSKRPVHHY